MTQQRDRSTTPYTLTTWPLTPRRTALVVIDMQNDFLSREGWYARSGVDIEHMCNAIKPTQALIEAAREQEIPVIWTQHGFRDATDAGVFATLRDFLKEGGLRKDTWGYELYSEMDARPDDWYVEKSRLSGFFATNLDIILRGLKAETVIICGVLTNQCVKATAVDASFRDYKPIVVKEATGTTLPHLHEPALEMISVGIGETRSLDQTLTDLKGLSNRINED
jgi:ureidoacrylate peracid hydrolase